WRAGPAPAGGLPRPAALAVPGRSRVGPLLRSLSDDRELVLLSTLTLLFGFRGLASWLARPIVVGSLLAGLALARLPVNGVVRIELAPIGDFFTALFFTALGALVQIPT